MTKNKMFQDLIKSINWGNWEVEGESKKHFDITDVLSCKLNWILEEGVINEESEHFNTIKETLMLLECLSEDDLKKIAEVSTNEVIK